MNHFNKGSIIESTKNIKDEFQGRIATYLTAAFGLVVGLAWNDAIKALIAYWFPIDKTSVLAKFLYAILLTIVFVLISMYIIKMLKKEDGEKK